MEPMSLKLKLQIRSVAFRENVIQIQFLIRFGGDDDLNSVSWNLSGAKLMFDDLHRARFKQNEVV